MRHRGIFVTRQLERYSSMSVLIVDDNVANVALLETLLRDEGVHRITTETDSRYAAEALPVVNPDLVLLDLHMPYVDGTQVLEQIMRFAAGTYLPVLVLTADVTLGARNRALSQGARDFLTKPLDITEATLRIANLLETRQLYSSLRGVEDSIIPIEEDLGPIRDRIEGVLRDASITPAFQRIVDVDTMANVGYEALARFDQPNVRGIPGWFSDAFRVGLGTELEWMAATKALAALEAMPPDTFLAVNMSPATILLLHEQILCRPELCSRVVIELTEHVPIEDYSALHASLRPMRKLGARLAADDLGSGYAGFRHLIALEPDIIKLDISLVSGIHLSPGARALSSALVAFASDVGAAVIAEGVEDALELAELQDLGVPWAQGYYLGRPEVSLDHAALPKIA
jgi:EAL domain-containing protein (putative c-di-GMP-specific phosphodiesterase class I)/ActR/RegA family two-component response regulator